MQIADWQFRPPLWACLLYGVLLVCMLWLGNWQLERAALKVSLQVSAARASDAAAVPLSSVVDWSGAATDYRRALVTGRYDPRRQFLWDNRTHKGRSGFEVISIIRQDDGVLALVNRGWVPPGASRQALPDVALPGKVLDSVITIEGYVSRPSKGFASGDAITGAEDWPKLLQYFDYEAIAQVLGEPIAPVLVQAQALGADTSTATVLTPRLEWYAANWQPAASGPEKHYSYAFQWFAMALALTGIFLVVNSRKSARGNSANELPVNVKKR